MKNRILRICSLLLALVLMFSLMPESSPASVGVKLNKTKASLALGQTLTLKVKGTGKKVKWASSNKKVAAVSAKGKVTAKKAGKATITATVGKKTCSCKVTVYGMKYTGYYRNDAQLIRDVKKALGDSEFLLDSSAKGKKCIAAMDTQTNAIVNAPTEIQKGSSYVQGVSYSGTAYYVDPQGGSDDNDGTSPERAFCTPSRLNGDWLKAGDAVFFKRGSIFYGCDLVLTDGVTYSAYGTGAKPIFTSSPEDANDPSNWELYYNKNGKKIWHYKNTDFASVGWIDFNCSDDLYAYPVYEYWTKEKGYQHIENVYVDYADFKSGEGYSRNRYGRLVTMSIEEQLADNLTFISRSAYGTGTDWTADTNLYLRCDEGNPAEVYSVVKFTAAVPNGYGELRTGPVVSYGKSNVTLDNLELSNGAQWGVGHLNNSTIQNCEVSFIGNTVWRYQPWAPKDIGRICIDYIGDGIYDCADGCVVRNNYVHHCCCVGIVGEHYEGRLDSWIVEGNVVKYTGNGFVFQEGNEWKNLKLGSIDIRKNYFAYQGQFDGILRWYNDFNGILVYGWDDSGKTDVYRYLAAHQNFTDNTVIGGYDSSVCSVMDGFRAIRTFRGNTFVGNAMDNAVMLMERESVIKYWQLCE